jgi:hypothetical protein
MGMRALEYVYGLVIVSSVANVPTLDNRTDVLSRGLMFVNGAKMCVDAVRFLLSIGLVTEYRNPDDTQCNNVLIVQCTMTWPESSSSSWWGGAAEVACFARRVWRAPNSAR